MSRILTLLLLALAFPAAAHDPEALSAEELAEIGRDHFMLDLYCPGKISVTTYSACPVCEPCPVPEPGSFLGLGACLLGLVGLHQRRAEPAAQDPDQPDASRRA